MSTTTIHASAGRTGRRERKTSQKAHELHEIGARVLVTEGGVVAIGLIGSLRGTVFSVRALTTEGGRELERGVTFTYEHARLVRWPLLTRRR